MRRFALVGNPNSGKTTLFNSLTGATAHVGNWPGVTVDKKEGLYKKCSEPINVIDLPGIYSFSPYTSEEVITRNFILDEKPDCVINIVDATHLERNLYLTTQLLEMNVPVVIALNLMDVIRKKGQDIDCNLLSARIGVPVVDISAQKGENIDKLMDIAFEESNKIRNGVSVLIKSELKDIVGKCEKAMIEHNVDNPLFHAVKLIENDEVEVNNHKELSLVIEEFKKGFNHEIFGSDLEAMIADARYQYITENLIFRKENIIEEDTSNKIDRILTHKWLGIPIFLVILFLVFHLTFSENLFFLGGLFENASPSFEGTIFEGLLWTSNGINSIGVILFNLVDSMTSWLGEIVAGWLSSSPQWVASFVSDGLLAGVFGVLSFVPQILVLFLFFSILEDTGYMARVAFILDRIFRKFGLTGRAFVPMIMGFGCSVPAMINTRTLGDDNEKTATIRVIPFFSCGAKLPILTGIAGAIVSMSSVANADVITYSMYLIGMITAVVTIILMRNTTMKGEVPPFIMELPSYRLPQFKSLMLHLWDKFKHYIEKAFTIILASTIVIWFLSSFSWTLQYIPDDIDKSILGTIGSFIAPVFSPLGFGANLDKNVWVFVVAAVTGLIAKENVIATFATIAACLGLATTGSEDGVAEVSAMIAATGITIPALLSFIAFNMTTIPCFATIATAKAELTNKRFWLTILFWIVTSYIVSMMIYLVGTHWWTVFIFIAIALIVSLAIYFYNKKSRKKN